MNAEELARFEAKVIRGDCWLWMGARTSPGYGELQMGSMKDGTRGPQLAHRLAYEHWVGPIPADLEIDHLCRVRACVNPEHLRLVTRMENLMAAGSECVAKRNAEKDHCLHGHAFDLENTYHRSNGWRECRTCVRDRQRERQRRIREVRHESRNSSPAAVR